MSDKIVTLKSLRPPAGQAESLGDKQQAKTPEGKLALARYYQIMRRLEQETDELVRMW